MPPPVSITVDHGSEFTSKALEEWAWRRSAKLDFIRPGKRMENGHIESFNGRLRDECLNVNQFLSLLSTGARSPLSRIAGPPLSSCRHHTHGATVRASALWTEVAGFMVSAISSSRARRCLRPATRRDVLGWMAVIGALPALGEPVAADTH